MGEEKCRYEIFDGLMEMRVHVWWLNHQACDFQPRREAHSSRKPNQEVKEETFKALK